MNLSPITKKSLLFSLLFSLVIMFGLFCFQFFDNRTLVVFCDVGQGDGTYIRLENKIDILVDAGPANNMMLTCLGKYMPFYDRTIEYVILSHPQIDHYGGLLEIMNRYNIISLYSLPLPEHTKSLRTLISILKNHQIPITTPKPQDTILLGQNSITFLSPSVTNIKSLEKDENDFSIVAKIQSASWRIFFTGDVTSRILNTLPISSEQIKTVIKIPHHGSKYGLSKRFFTLAEPREVVISVGKNNPYGHPAKAVIDYLEAQKIKIRRTDKEGGIVYKF